MTAASPLSCIDTHWSVLEKFDLGNDETLLWYGEDRDLPDQAVVRYALTGVLEQRFCVEDVKPLVRMLDRLLMFKFGARAEPERIPLSKG